MKAQEQFHLHLGQILGLVAQQVIVEAARRHAPQGQPAEVDLVDAPPGFEVFLPAPRDLVEPRALTHEERRAFAPEGFILLSSQERPRGSRLAPLTMLRISSQARAESSRRKVP